MHSFRRQSPFFSLPGSPPFSRRQFDRFFPSASRGRAIGVWSTLKFIGLLPIALAMLVVSVAARLAMILVPLLLIPLAILVPVLGLAGLVLLAGFVLQVLGVGS